MTTATIGSREARKNWRDLLDAAYSGQQDAIIERNGKPVAALIPYEDYVALEEMLADIRAARRAEAMPEASRQTGRSYIVASVFGDEEFIKQALTAGARRFLVKPFSRDELVKAIRRSRIERPSPWVGLGGSLLKRIQKQRQASESLPAGSAKIRLLSRPKKGTFRKSDAHSRKNHEETFLVLLNCR